MSLATLLISNEINELSFEDDGVDYDAMSSGHVNDMMSMESCSRDLDEIDHMQSGLSNIYDALDSSRRDLSMESARYMSLALDAAMGAPQTIHIGSHVIRTHENEFTMMEEGGEKDKEEQKDGIFKKMWNALVAAYHKVIDFFKRGFSSVMSFFSKKDRYDKKLKELQSKLKDYKEPKEYTLNKTLAGSLAGSGTNDLGDINDRLSNFNVLLDIGDTLTDSLMEMIDTLDPKEGLDEKKLEGLSDAVKKIQVPSSDKPLPGDQKVQGQKYSETMIGKAVARIFGDDSKFRKNENVIVAIRLTGDRPDKEIKFSSVPNDNDLSKLSTELSSLSTNIDDLKLLQKPMKLISNLRAPREKPDGMWDKLKGKVGDVKDTLALRSAVATSPITRLPASLIGESYRVYGAGLKLLDSLL